MDNQDKLQNLLSRMILRALANGFDPASRVDLHNLELRILARLVADGPATMAELRAEGDFPRSTLTDAADRLEARQLLQRAPDLRDRRRVVLSSTQAAHFTVLQSTAGLKPLVMSMLLVLSDGEIQDLLDLLHRAIEGLF